MKVVKKVFKFMDNLYLDYDTCEHDCADWLHKEDIKKVYIVIDQNELNEIEKLRSLPDQLDSFHNLGLETFFNKEVAEMEMQTENNFKIN